MVTKMKSLMALLLCVALMLSAVSCTSKIAEPELKNQQQSATEELSRGAAQEQIYQTASKYKEDLTFDAVVSGLPEGEAAKAVTRAEALTMLSNAFGAFPKPTGDAVRRAAGVATYTDTPDFAKAAIENLNSGLLLVPAEDGLLKPDEAITEKELDTYLRRIWALYGTRPQDDFYAYINKEWLDHAEMPEGQDRGGSMWAVAKKSTDQIDAILDEILNGTWEKGTPQRKLVDWYNAQIDVAGQNKAGATPLKPYLDQLSAVKTVADLNAALETLAEDTACFPYIGVWNQQDHLNGRKYAIYLSARFEFIMPEGFAELVSKAFKVSGVKKPGEAGKLAVDMQTRIDEACKDFQGTEELSSYEQQLKNQRTPAAEAKALVSYVDLDALLAAVGLSPEAEYYVQESSKSRLKALAALYTDENASALAALAQYKLIDMYKSAMGSLFADPKDPVRTSEELAESARNTIKMAFQDFLAPIYMERYVPEGSKAELTKMAREMVEVYKNNIQKLDWMSSSTKAMATKKLDAMILQMAYPDKFENFTDALQIRSPEEGGSYLECDMAKWRAMMQVNAEAQGKPKEYMSSMNAFYDAAGDATQEQNGITVAAGLLLPPVYNPDAGTEENMASIGWVIAHEISHNFDSKGARYGENGGLIDWWTAEDKEKFAELCKGVSTYYADMEYAPGLVREASELSIDESVADLGGAACALAALKKLKPNPDYELFFKSVAILWQESMTRQTYGEMKNDSHAAGRNRTNLVIKTLPEFYETYDIQPGDGMYVAPENRVKVW